MREAGHRPRARARSSAWSASCARYLLQATEALRIGIRRLGQRAGGGHHGHAGGLAACRSASSASGSTRPCRRTPFIASLVDVLGPARVLQRRARDLRAAAVRSQTRWHSRSASSAAPRSSSASSRSAPGDCSRSRTARSSQSSRRSTLDARRRPRHHHLRHGAHLGRPTAPPSARWPAAVGSAATR